MSTFVLPVQPIAPRREVRDLPDDLNTFVSADFDTGIDAFSFGRRLQEMREMIGLTQTEVAEYVTETLGFRVTSKTIHSYEKNQMGRARHVRLDIALEIARLCRFDPAKLFTKNWGGWR